MRKIVLAAGAATLSVLPMAALAAYSEPTNADIIQGVILGAVLFAVVGVAATRKLLGTGICAIIGGLVGLWLVVM